MANFNLNKVILGGRLTADPELKTTQSGVSVAQFSVAVGRKVIPGKPQETDFFNVTAWRQTAEFVSRYFRKGSSICIVGTVQNNSWTDKDGQKRYKTDIVADEVMFVDSKGDSVSAPAFNPANVPHFEEIKQDEDLPF